jgi:hypothetical protein
MRLASLLLLSACGGAPADSAAPDAGCAHGLDADGDGVCDGDAVDWSEGASIEPGTNRANLYELSQEHLAAAREAGMLHAFQWPVEVTGLLIPHEPFARFAADPANEGAVDLMRQQMGFGDFDEFYDWLGLARYPGPDATGIYDLPVPAGWGPGDPVGATFLDSPEGPPGMTFSCATCHTGTLFGQTVFGMTNRRARANAVFLLAGELARTMPPDAFEQLMGASPEERALYERTIDRYHSVGAKVPEVLGLDTAVAQIGLSLGKRGDDPWAEFDPAKEADPDFAHLETYVADSKPAVWWTLKYKTRWLADGTLVSGNPIVYNFLANELGRGTDLHELADWQTRNERVLDELTIAVFAAEAPRWTDFFAAETVDEAAAMRGEAAFEARCSGCHGSYEKGWSAADAGSRDAAARLETTRVVYHAQTPVMDVGTDLQRASGGAVFVERLNQLRIIEDAGARFQGEDGYVPPPLDGIWARYPYLHNNSVPTLCDLLAPADERPVEFWQGPADDPETDFDADCVGYPVGDAVPAAWQDEPDAHFDATLPGLTNAGHDEMLRAADGSWDLGDAERADLIAFLKTL